MVAENQAGQSSIELGELEHMPATVSDHTRLNDRIRLHTNHPTSESDIDAFDDGRSAKRVGADPE